MPDEKGPLQRWVRSLGRFLVAEGIIVLAAPAVAYGLAYAQAIGYAAFFRMPTDLIKVGPHSLVAVAMVSFVLVLFALECSALSLLETRVRDSETRYLRDELALLVGGLLLLAIEGMAGILITSFSRRIRVVIPLSILVLASVLGVARPLFLGKLIAKNRGGWRSWLSVGYGMMRNSRALELLVAFVLGFALFGAIYTADEVGYSIAKHQTRFTVARRAGVEYVVLQHSDDDLVVAPFLRTIRQLRPEFRVLRVKDTDPVVLTTEHLGELTVTDAERGPSIPQVKLPDQAPSLSQRPSVSPHPVP